MKCRSHLTWIYCFVMPSQSFFYSVSHVLIEFSVLIFFLIFERFQNTTPIFILSRLMLVQYVSIVHSLRVYSHFIAHTLWIFYLHVICWNFFTLSIDNISVVLIQKYQKILGSNWHYLFHQYCLMLIIW